MKIIVSTPYRENSIVNLARIVDQAKYLDVFYTTLYLAKYKKIIRKIPGLGPMLESEFSRRDFTEITPGRIKTVSSTFELTRAITKRVLSKSLPVIPEYLMYRGTYLFDKAVSKSLVHANPQIFVGMYAASLSSFTVLKPRGVLTVLNLVNSHPKSHNRYLTQLAKLNPSHHELIPNWVSLRVEAELAIVDLILVPSHFVSNQLVEHGVSKDKIVVIPYGVDLQSFHPSTKKSTQLDVVDCLVVSQISYRKGIPVLLEAAKQLQGVPVKFRLIGPMLSPKALSGLPENVVYEGAIYPGCVADIMRQADLFVLPTLEDSFGLVVSEAMASGLPVISTNHAGASEVIDQGVSGIIVPAGDVEALTDSIRRLATSPDLRYALGQAARLKIQEAYSWDSYGKRVLEKMNSRCQELGLCVWNNG